MKILRFLPALFVMAGLFTACQAPTEKADMEVTKIMIGDKEYALEEIEEIVALHEQSMNPNDIDSLYTGVSIPPTAGGPISIAEAKERVSYFRDSHSSRYGQPYGFSYGLNIIDELRAEIQKINEASISAGGKAVYSGIRIYVTRSRTTGEWNTVILGVSPDGKDALSIDHPIVNPPVYNSSLPCPYECS